MAFIQSIILYALCIAFFFGQLIRLDFQNISFPLIDIFIAAFSIVNILIKIKSRNLKIHNHPFLFFLIAAWLSFFINGFIYHFPLIKPFFYLLRLSFLLSFFVFPPVINKKNTSFFKICLVANIVFGLIQYFFWPDIRPFNALNWDPHLYRLVSTFLDPTFSGLIYLLFLINLFFSSSALLPFCYFALALTYSRSTLLSLLASSIFLSVSKKKPKIFVVCLLIILLTLAVLPRQEGEGTKLERTSTIKAKIVNYQEGLSLFTRSPIIGFGYNNLSYVRQLQNPSSHSASGFDSSLVTILSTTGIIGFTFFIFGLKKLFSYASLERKTMLIAVIIHSLFANSLLYPHTLLFLVLI